MNIETLLRETIARKASDLHLSSGTPAMIRVDGDLLPVSQEPLHSKDIEAAAASLMNESQRSRFEAQRECDFSFELAGVSRFRANVFWQARGASVAFRPIARDMPNLDQLGAPKLFAELANKPRGLVLVTGPTGSGKSTTLAAMVNWLNQTEAKHILTIEDPIEFVHPPTRGLVQQREGGGHTLSFANALRSALREDPDVILVGELRDLESIRLALTAAETGHLVLGTLHTSGAAKTIDRIIDVFPAEEKELVRTMLSESIEAVISQVLCKRAEGKGRVAAYEIMLGSPAIRNLIREGKLAQVYSVMQTGSASGMQTLDQSLSALVQQGRIAKEEAASKARYPTQL